ncbi:hypothetical protein GQ53DRAFT_750706 [Thozetella sp. PMI_491]|nr:hypothetical protein GQ53DRAFT_750706 [Thozetella sp. PMI_491]
MAKLYEIDPEADVLVVVSEPTSPFAPWEPSKPAAAAVSATPVVSSPYANLFPDRLLVQSGLTRTPAPVSSPYGNLFPARLLSYTGLTRPAPAPAPALHIKASSRHLSLASKAFRSKLQFADAKPDGRVHISVDGFDPAAVKIVLDAVHGRGRRVPRSVDLETLAKIAAFVDKFQLFEAVEVYAERWIDGLSAPEAYGRDLILWIYVAYVFHQNDLFAEATKTAITQSTEPIRNLGLPIREKVIKTIDSERQQVVGRSLNALAEVVEDLRTGKESYASGYDAFLLGSLFKHPSRLLWPQPARPFPGISYSTIRQTIDEVQESTARLLAARSAPSLSLAKKRKVPHFPETPPSPESSPEPVSRHGLFEPHDTIPDIFGAALAKLGEEIKGLELESSLGYYLY